jgi:hypothetical protein
MNSTNTSDFINLDRTFHELSKNSSENDDVDINQTFYVGDRLHWQDLIQEYRLVILSEAGSGKTAEIRNIANKLRAEEKPAFFLRLENISRDFEDASFDVGTYEAFEKWLASNEEGWLLLDSVDESPLRDPRDFELAIRKLSKRIEAAMDRTHIVITSRAPAWRPKTDLAHCTTHLPFNVGDTSECDLQVENDAPNGSIQTKTDNQKRDRQIFKIVALDDLISDQIRVFAEAKGINDSQAFLDEVERKDAWSFTSRPQDLEELTEFWIDNKQIGSRLEIMKNSIERRLTERDQNRADSRPLSPERALQGVRLLAAATTLAKTQTIRVPDGANYFEGIDVKVLLSDWDDNDRLTLLSRPIFDGAIYGTVRFHHRSVREYLAAEWFAELLKRETSRRNIEGLFFHNQYGLDIIVPTLRPLLPWLIILDEKIRNHVRKVAPEIIFEGGDPSYLPLDARRYILKEVCEQIAKGTTNRSMRNYAAVQRFANLDMTDDIRELIRKYADNEDTTKFLLRIVSIGQIVDALPETMNVALTPDAEQYVRISAFKAIKAIGSTENQEQVRQRFLAETSEIKRELLAELLDDIQPTEQILSWLLSCLRKCKPKERYSVDNLTQKVTRFIETIDIKLLPQLVICLNGLLSFPPMIDPQHCQISEKYQWLMAPASKAVERMIFERHPKSLELDSLAILHKLLNARGYYIDGLENIKDEFLRLVPVWKDLNRALFWFEVQILRKSFDEKLGQRLIDFWQASIFGSFWRFEEGDLEYIAEEISHQMLMDDKLVALSLAFDLYKLANRPRIWRMKLKKLVDGNKDLSEYLNNYLKPPAQNQDSLYRRQQESKWKKHNKAQQKKQDKYHMDWKKDFNDNLDKFQASIQHNPGNVTDSLLYLLDQTMAKNSRQEHWADYNWKILIPDYGEEIAQFYRDSTISFWRHHKPKLKSEGAPPNETTHAVIIGLTGIESEVNETQDWHANLSIAEVELACKYASFELNGFPTWLPALFATHPKIVCEFFMQEIQYELSIEQVETETHYMISDVSCSGQWAWDQMAPSIYEILKSIEPKNISNLEDLLKIIQGSNLPDSQIEGLAAQKCFVLNELDHLARWFAVWTGVAPDAAIGAFKTRIEKISDREEQTKFAMTFVTHLWGSHRGDGISFRTPKHLNSLYLLIYEYIRYEEDINRIGVGAYSPELRDNAQTARNNLLNLLKEIPGKESFLALRDIANIHPEETSRPWITLYAKTIAEHDGDIEPWLPQQVKDFQESLDRTPKNHRELAELAVLRLLDLKDDLENGDSSIANILKSVTQETDMRKYIGRELRGKAFGRYSIPQEEQFADDKRPDLRFHGVNFDGPVPVELKLANSNWSGSKLLERLENQLCADYLRDNHSNRGIFLLVYLGSKTSWELPDSNNRVDFTGLITALEEHWLQISPKFPNVDDITIIGIDLTKRSS